MRSVARYIVLTALFKTVSVAIHESPAAKRNHFQCFILTLKKLQLNLSNYDHAWRFGISEATVSHAFSCWIEAMDTLEMWFDTRLSLLINWSDRDSLQSTMPFC